MKHIHFDVESDGFYGAYWACKDGSDCAVIAMLGDDPEDPSSYQIISIMCFNSGSFISSLILS